MIEEVMERNGGLAPFVRAVVPEERPVETTAYWRCWDYEMTTKDGGRYGMEQA